MVEAPPAGALASAPRQLEFLLQSAARYADAATSDNTKKAYASQWDRFCEWCAAQEGEALTAMPAAPVTVALYLASLADRGLSAASIDVALAAISKAHEVKGLESPRRSMIVRSVRSGIRRLHGTAQRHATPLEIPRLRLVVASLSDDLIDVRDRALMLLAFAGALRRSELVALDVPDLGWREGGIALRLRRSKTDQEGAGVTVAIAAAAAADVCPVLAVRAWLDRSGIKAGAVFVGLRGSHQSKRLGAGDVARIVKRRAGEEFAGHGLRAGMATAAARAGVPEDKIMIITRHRNRAVLARYVQDATAFEENPARGLL
jgi:integrase